MSPPRVAVRPAEAIEEISFALGYHGGDLPVYLNGAPNPHRRLSCENPRARAGVRLARLAAHLDHAESAEVAVGLPTRQEFVYHSTVLWCWVKSGDSVKRAGRFKPAPSIVLKLGASQERLLIWVLNQPVDVALVEPHNARLAYALHAPRTRCKPEKLRLPLPGTFIRQGRSRPSPVLVTRLSVGPKLHAWDRITGDLKDPPPSDAWKERRR